MTPCTKCDSKAHARTSLRRHMIVPHKEKYQCNDCDMEDLDQGVCWNSQNDMSDG